MVPLLSLNHFPGPTSASPPLRAPPIVRLKPSIPSTSGITPTTVATAVKLIVSCLAATGSGLVRIHAVGVKAATVVCVLKRVLVGVVRAAAWKHGVERVLVDMRVVFGAWTFRAGCGCFVYQVEAEKY